jgi:hypothetical protein
VVYNTHIGINLQGYILSLDLIIIVVYILRYSNMEGIYYE